MFSWFCFHVKCETLQLKLKKGLSQNSELETEGYFGLELRIRTFNDTGPYLFTAT